MEFTLGSKVKSVAIFDKDYRSSEEIDAITQDCAKFCDFASVHQRKEIENFLLVPAAIDRAAERKLSDRCNRVGASIKYQPIAQEVLDNFSEEKKSYVASRVLAKRREYMRAISPKLDDATVTECGLKEFEVCWSIVERRLMMLPGKDALAAVNEALQSKFGVNVTPTAIIDAMEADEIPKEMKALLDNLAAFSTVQS